MKTKQIFQVISFFIIILFTLIFTISFLNTTVQGASRKPSKSYVTVTVKNHDNLWDISKKYINYNYYDMNAYIEEVMSINSLNDSMIYVDDHITLPIVQ